MRRAQDMVMILEDEVIDTSPEYLIQYLYQTVVCGKDSILAYFGRTTKEDCMHDETNKGPSSFHEEMENLSDEEKEEMIIDRILDQGEIDIENLLVQCQEDIVSVEGIVPSAAQYQLLISLLRDELNLENVVDRVRVQDEVVFDDDEDGNFSGEDSEWIGPGEIEPDL